MKLQCRIEYGVIGALRLRFRQQKSIEFNATVQVYPFRPFNGNIEQMFQKTLLREWIDPRYQETNVAGQSEFRLGNVRGAQIVLTARYAENVAGMFRQHMRMVIVSGGKAAIVDASANNATIRSIPAATP